MEEWTKKYRKLLRYCIGLNGIMLLFCSMYWFVSTEREEVIQVRERQWNLFTNYRQLEKETAENVGKSQVTLVETGKSIKNYANEKVIPGGNPVGIYIETNGSLVLGTQSVKGEDGKQYEPAKNIVKTGDYIKMVNNIPIHSKEELVGIVKKNGKKPIVLQILRRNKVIKVKIIPVYAKEYGEYQLGIWVRDNSQGIGTMTYIRGTRFAALGHGIHDIDTGGLMNVNSGYLFGSKILAIEKGAKGKPGEMVGVVCYDFDKPFGKIQNNNDYGIYGEVCDEVRSQVKQEEVEIGRREDVKKGKAYIRSAISGEMVDYEIEITNVDAKSKNLDNGMIIKIIDPKLLEQTNGIVQGMSGTPILQNGKLIGAVTHVFVQDSTKGYGTFIENMLE